MILDTAQARTPQEVYQLVEREGLQAGDSLKVVQKPVLDKQTAATAFLIVLVAVLWYMNAKAKREKEQFASDLLDDLFKKYNSAEELERELQQEFNVAVTTEIVEDSWASDSMRTFERAAYAEDEPDISHIEVKEPNPHYRPWKEGA